MQQGVLSDGSPGPRQLLRAAEAELLQEGALPTPQHPAAADDGSHRDRPAATTTLGPGFPPGQREPPVAGRGDVRGCGRVLQQRRVAVSDPRPEAPVRQRDAGELWEPAVGRPCLPEAAPHLPSGARGHALRRGPAGLRLPDTLLPRPFAVPSSEKLQELVSFLWTSYSRAQKASSLHSGPSLCRASDPCLSRFPLTASVRARRMMPAVQTALAWVVQAQRDGVTLPGCTATRCGSWDFSPGGPTRGARRTPVCLVYCGPLAHYLTPSSGVQDQMVGPQ